MAKKSKGFVSELEANRTALLEFVLTVVLLAFAINLLADWVYSLLPLHVSKWLGAGILVGVALYWSFRQFSTTKNLSYEGFILIDEEARTVLPVEGYEICEDAHRYLTAAFAENPALRTQWERGRLGLAGMILRQSNEENPAAKLICELLEYIGLEKLSTHLTDFFNDSEFDKQLLRAYERKDIPEILLRNRFLELFSRPMKDRASFKTGGDEEPRRLPGYQPGEVVFQTGEDGAIYSRFELILPAKSTMKALPGGGFEVEAPAMRLAVEATFLGDGVSLPADFFARYVGKPLFRPTAEGPELNLDAYRVTFNVRFSPKFTGVFSRRALKYYRWIDSFCDDLEAYVSYDSFLRRIQWPTVEAVLRCLSPQNPEGSNVRGENGPPRHVRMYELYFVYRNGKGQQACAHWPLFMPATTYSPMQFPAQYHRPCGA